jgi:hypothetical protein
MCSLNSSASLSRDLHKHLLYAECEPPFVLNGIRDATRWLSGNVTRLCYRICFYPTTCKHTSFISYIFIMKKKIDYVDSTSTKEFLLRWANKTNSNSNQLCKLARHQNTNVLCTILIESCRWNRESFIDYSVMSEYGLHFLFSVRYMWRLWDCKNI